MDFNELYHKAFEGDSAAEAELFRLLAVMFQIFVRRRGVGTEDIEDTVHNALAKILRSYRQGEPKTNFAAWAQTVIKNEFIDFTRSRSAERRRQEEMTVKYRIPTLSEPDLGLKAKLLDCLQKLHAVNPVHARIVNLHYQGFDSGEVCGKLGISANHRRVALCRARAMLRACLEKGGSRDE